MTKFSSLTTNELGIPEGIRPHFITHEKKEYILSRWETTKNRWVYFTKSFKRKLVVRRSPYRPTENH